MNTSAMLSREDILNLIKANPPLVENMPDIEQQVQPNGLDLTVKDIASFSSSGRIGKQNESRIISEAVPLVFDELGNVDLPPGCYLITFNEVVNIPGNIMALAWPRSSLLRCGVSVHNAVWDAGYSGRSQALMVVFNPHGFRLQKDARLIQLVFMHLSQEVAEGYKGIFQGENIQ